MGIPTRDVIVRPVRSPEDWRAVRDLCCATGDAGDPIAAERWPFFAELWIGPYERLVPEWTSVAESAGQVVGYLTGCPATAAFERARRAVIRRLLARVALGRYGWTADTRRFVRQALGLERGPEQRFPPALHRQLGADYPAHLHMNVGASFRREGIGGALLGRYLSDLTTRGVPGVHLFCGPAPVPFYARAGFGTLATVDVGRVRVYALGRRLATPRDGPEPQTASGRPKS